MVLKFHFYYLLPTERTLKKRSIAVMFYGVDTVEQHVKVMLVHERGVSEINDISPTAELTIYYSIVNMKGSLIVKKQLDTVMPDMW